MPEKWEHLLRQNMRQQKYNTKQKRHVLESRLPTSVVMVLRKCCRLSLSDLAFFVNKWEQRSSTNVEPETSTKANDEPITICVKNQTGEETMFKIKQSTKMSTVFTAHAQQNSVDVKSVRFLLDGERINETDTPEMLELQDGEQIDCVLQQVGGGDNDDGDNKENVKPTMKTNKHRRVLNQQSQRSKKHRHSNESNVSDSMIENETIQMNMSTKKQNEKLPLSVSSLKVVVFTFYILILLINILFFVRWFGRSLRNLSSLHIIFLRLCIG